MTSTGRPGHKPQDPPPVTPDAPAAELRAQLEAELARRRDVEAALLKLEKALATMQLGVTITDLDGKILYANLADAAMHGYRPDELLGQDVGVYCVSHARKPLTLKRLRALSSWRRESTNTRRDGSTFPVQLMSDVVEDPDGNPVGIVTTCEDITERRRAQDALEQAYAELDKRVLERTRELSEANEQLREQMAERRKATKLRQALEAQLRQAQKMEALGQLTGGIAHDFNNLLTVILANAELVRRSLPKDVERLGEDLDELEGAAWKARDMIQKLLGFSRRQALSVRRVDLVDLVADLSSMLKRLIPERIQIEVAFDDEVPPVRADPGALEQILINLATNARDAMPERGVLRIAMARKVVEPTEPSATTTVRAGDYARITVSDTGVGMDERTRERLFEPFFTTKPFGMGSGLGMAMVYGLVEQHGGFVEVQSRVGSGTSVMIYLPLAATTDSGEREAPLEVDGLPDGTETVLLVEDEDRLRASGKKILEKFGYTVIAASDGQEALEILQGGRHAIDLVVSDVVMPRMNGFELREAANRGGHQVTFLFTSGYAARDAEAPLRIPPGVPFLPKPWSLSDLVLQVRTVLDTQREPGADSA